MDDREDELRRSIARDRTARRVLAAMAAEKMARAKLLEGGIEEQMHLRERLLADRARYLEEIARVRAETAQIKAERDAAAAIVFGLDRGSGGGGSGGGRVKAGKGPRGGRRGAGGAGPDAPAAT